MFFNTMGGRTFFEAHVPALIKALRNISEALTKMADRLDEDTQAEELKKLKSRVECLELTVATLLVFIDSSTVDPNVKGQIEALKKIRMEWENVEDV